MEPLQRAGVAVRDRAHDHQTADPGLAGSVAEPSHHVAAVGLAGDSRLDVSLMPFLLRGVNLLGVNSAATPRARRLAIWQRIATELAPRHLDRIATRTVTLAELPQAFESLITGRNAGRTVVRIHDSAE